MRAGDILVLTAVLLLVLLLLWRGTARRAKKMPAREDVRGCTLLYADQKQDGREGFGKVLYAARYDLRGKPDYVFQSRIRRRIIPVELKSGSIGEAEAPHHGDLLQLAAYFLLLEDVYGKRPPFGRLVYRDFMFQIRNTKALRREALRTMQEMRQMLRDGDAVPKNSFAHCRPCVCNGTVCPFSAAETEGETK